MHCLKSSSNCFKLKSTLQFSDTQFSWLQRAATGHRQGRRQSSPGSCPRDGSLSGPAERWEPTEETHTRRCTAAQLTMSTEYQAQREWRMCRENCANNMVGRESLTSTVLKNTLTIKILTAKATPWWYKPETLKNVRHYSSIKKNCLIAWFFIIHASLETYEHTRIQKIFTYTIPLKNYFFAFT